MQTLVLDAPVPLSSSPLEAPRTRYATLQQVLTDCAAEPECALAYPDLAQRLSFVLTRLDTAPGTEYGTGSQLVDLILRTLEAEGGRRIPALITALYRGNVAKACSLVPGAGCSPFAPSAGEAKLRLWWRPR